MKKCSLDRWLRLAGSTATLVYIAALCVAAALVVIGFVPRSPVKLDLPISLSSGSSGLSKLASGVVVDSAGRVSITLVDPSLGQRMLYLATMLPGLLLVALVARRMANLLRAAQDRDPFSVQTVRELGRIAKITAFGGLGVWAVATIAKWALSATVLASGPAVEAHQTPLGWLAVGLIFAAFAQLISRGVAMRAELDSVI